jgi:hypothetical protein
MTVHDRIARIARRGSELVPADVGGLGWGCHPPLVVKSHRLHHGIDTNGRDDQAAGWGGRASDGTGLGEQGVRRRRHLRSNGVPDPIGMGSGPGPTGSQHHCTHHQHPAGAKTAPAPLARIPGCFTASHSEGKEERGSHNPYAYGQPPPLDRPRQPLTSSPWGSHWASPYDPSTFTFELRLGPQAQSGDKGWRSSRPPRATSCQPVLQEVKREPAVGLASLSHQPGHSFGGPIGPLPQPEVGPRRSTGAAMARWTFTNLQLNPTSLRVRTDGFRTHHARSRDWRHSTPLVPSDGEVGPRAPRSHLLSPGPPCELPAWPTSQTNSKPRTACPGGRHPRLKKANRMRRREPTPRPGWGAGRDPACTGQGVGFVPQLVSRPRTAIRRSISALGQDGCPLILGDGGVGARPLDEAGMSWGQPRS